MDWDEAIPSAFIWAEKSRPVMQLLRPKIGAILAPESVSVFYNPEDDLVAYHATTKPGLAAVKTACENSKLAEKVLKKPISIAEVVNGPWVKIAYSPFLRRVGEILNFLPRSKGNPIPNAPSPLTAALTSGLIGAGLGWAVGRSIREVLPDSYGEKLPRTGTIIGALAGLPLPILWVIANASLNKPLNSSDLVRGERPRNYQKYDIPGHKLLTPDSFTTKLRKILFDGSKKKNKEIDIDDEGMKYANFGAFSSFGQQNQEFRKPGPFDVHLDSFGNTLWNSNASTPLAATAVGTMLAAKSLNSPTNKPGWVSGDQLGQLALRMGRSYSIGLLAGGALNALVGTPYSSPAIASGVLAANVIDSVMSKFFGDK